MNIVMIMSGGVGERFGAVIPKQYNMIAGKPVIDFVIEAVNASKKADKVIVVMDPKWKDYSILLDTCDFAIALNGKTRFESMKNGLDLIHDHYPECQKLVVVDAVAPFIYPELLDYYFDSLDEYDAVITAQKITGGFTDKNNTPLDREDYIITQSPEGFNYPLLYQCFDVNYPYQETACMLPKESKRLYYYGFKNNLKLTYSFELEYAEYALRNANKKMADPEEIYFDKNIFYTEGIRSYLLRNENEKTEAWLQRIYEIFPSLIRRWGITSFAASQSSRFGLVLLAQSKQYGPVVMKFIPWFVNRFERELEAMKYLSTEYMVELYDYIEEERVMLLYRVKDGSRYARFEEEEKLTTFFTSVMNHVVEYTDQTPLKYIPPYFEELCGKLAAIDTVPYNKREVKDELEYAIRLYAKEFMDCKKFILHGDLHELNILNDGERYWGVDPNGMWAPLELECVRFIRNDVRNHVNEGYETRFKKLLDYFKQFVDLNKLVKMFIIDMAFCTFNSTFENETPEETLVDLELINIAKRWLKEED